MIHLLNKLAGIKCIGSLSTQVISHTVPSKPSFPYACGHNTSFTLTSKCHHVYVCTPNTVCVGVHHINLWVWGKDSDCSGNEMFLHQQDSGGLNGRICDKRIERERQRRGRVREESESLGGVK